MSGLSRRRLRCIRNHICHTTTTTVVSGSVTTQYSQKSEDIESGAPGSFVQNGPMLNIVCKFLHQGCRFTCLSQQLTATAVLGRKIIVRTAIAFIEELSRMLASAIDRLISVSLCCIMLYSCSHSVPDPNLLVLLQKERTTLICTSALVSTVAAWSLSKVIREQMLSYSSRSSERSPLRNSLPDRLTHRSNPAKQSFRISTME